MGNIRRRFSLGVISWYYLSHVYVFIQPLISTPKWFKVNIISYKRIVLLYVFITIEIFFKFNFSMKLCDIIRQLLIIAFIWGGVNFSPFNKTDIFCFDNFLDRLNILMCSYQFLFPPG